MNNLTLLIDFNWLAMSRVCIYAKSLKKDLNETIKASAIEEFQELIAKSINITLNRLPDIDNIIIVSDGGSWRKRLEHPEQMKNINYKGNRSDNFLDLDWDYIFKAFADTINNYKELGITCSQSYECEGDDWAWYWSEYLNSKGINCIIWSGDNDLKQLVNINPVNNSFTAWYNDKKGIFLKDTKNVFFDAFNFFLQPNNNDIILENTRNRISKETFINPEEIVINKIFCGDTGDNIKAVVRYKKNNRTYNFSQKDYEKLIKDIDIQTVKDITDKKHEIIDYIISMKKFKAYNFDKADISAMIDYNINLVYLNKDIIPEDIKESMSKSEYKLFDINLIRYNYKTLVKTDNDITNLFENIN